MNIPQEADQTPEPDITPGGPRHVAIIMDGNGRWAQKRGRPRLFGHHACARRVRDIVAACPDQGVKYLTIFSFSTVNWKRTPSDLSGLMSLFRKYIHRDAKSLLATACRASAPSLYTARSRMGRPCPPSATGIGDQGPEWA